jgi:hypothetical protein
MRATYDPPFPSCSQVATTCSFVEPFLGMGAGYVQVSAELKTPEQRTALTQPHRHYNKSGNKAHSPPRKNKPRHRTFPTGRSAWLNPFLD